jgi:hypothetical protein
MQLSRMVTNRGLSAARTLWRTVSPVLYFLALLSLFPAMLVVQFGLEHAFGVMEADSGNRIRWLSWCALGLVWLFGVVSLVEFYRYPANDANEGNGASAPHRPVSPPKYQAWEAVFPPGGLTVIEMVLIQWITIVLYALMLDGGISFRGCLYSYVGYLVGVFVPLARRGLAPTKGDLIYLKWAWLPWITVGVPLFVSISKGKWPIG